jgi:hypothetical protein
MIPKKYLSEMERYEKEPDFYGTITVQLHRKGPKVKPRYVFNYEESSIEETDELSADLVSAYKEENRSQRKTG